MLGITRVERSENLMALYITGDTYYPAYPQVTYPPYPEVKYQPYPQITYPAYPQSYSMPYFESVIYRVHYKIEHPNGTQQQFNMDLQAYNENDAFQRALRYLPPYSQIKKIRLHYKHPHL
jgi:hypothetical protein